MIRTRPSWTSRRAMAVIENRLRKNELTCRGNTCFAAKCGGIKLADILVLRGHCMHLCRPPGCIPDSDLAAPRYRSIPHHSSVFHCDVVAVVAPGDKDLQPAKA